VLPLAPQAANAFDSNVQARHAYAAIGEHHLNPRDAIPCRDGEFHQVRSRMSPISEAIMNPVTQPIPGVVINKGMWRWSAP
jgi:hypothetical protein